MEATAVAALSHLLPSTRVHRDCSIVFHAGPWLECVALSRIECCVMCGWARRAEQQFYIFIITYSFFLFSVCLRVLSSLRWRRRRHQMPVEVEQYIRFGAVAAFDFLCFCSQFNAAPRKLSKADMKNKNNRRILRLFVFISAELLNCIFFLSTFALQFLVLERQSDDWSSLLAYRYVFASVPASICDFDWAASHNSCCCGFLSCRI